VGDVRRRADRAVGTNLLAVLQDPVGERCDVADAVAVWSDVAIVVLRKAQDDGQRVGGRGAGATQFRRSLRE